MFYKNVAAIRAEQKEQFSVVCQGNAAHIHDALTGGTVTMPVTLMLMAPDLYQAVQDLLAFIKANDMGGDWCQENYPAIRRAKEVLGRL